MVMMVGAPRKGEMMAVADLWDVAMLRFYGGVGGDVRDLWWLHVVISEKRVFGDFRVCSEGAICELGSGSISE